MLNIVKEGNYYLVLETPEPTEFKLLMVLLKIPELKSMFKIRDTEETGAWVAQ